MFTTRTLRTPPFLVFLTKAFWWCMLARWHKRRPEIAAKLQFLQTFLPSSGVIFCAGHQLAD
jgi:hypothetical protein